MLSGTREPVDETLLCLVVEREIRVLLKHADFSQLLGRNARDGDVRDAAVFKTQPRVGDVLAAAQHGYTDGIDTLQRRADEVQDDLDVVDHQVEHNADFDAAVRIRREPVRFDETRTRQSRFERAEHGIEPFDVADLQDESARVGEFGKSFCVSRRLGDRFFDKDVFAAFEKKFSHREMGRRRRGDGCRIDKRRKFFERCACLRSETRGHFLRGRGVCVVDRREFHIAQF